MAEVQQASDAGVGFTDRRYDGLLDIPNLDERDRQFRERTIEEGWLHDGSQSTEGEVLMLLHALVRSTKPKMCVETGTYNGYGTQAIHDALVANGKGFLHTVEINSEIVVRCWKLDLPRVKFHCADAAEWCRKEAPDEIDFAFVDSGPQSRIDDVDGLWPKMTQGGLLLIHDTIYIPDLLPAAIDKLGPPHLHIESLNGLGIWQKD